MSTTVDVGIPEGQGACRPQKGRVRRVTLRPPCSRVLSDIGNGRSENIVLHQSEVTGKTLRDGSDGRGHRTAPTDVCERTSQSAQGHPLPCTILLGETRAPNCRIGKGRSRAPRSLGLCHRLSRACSSAMPQGCHYRGSSIGRGSDMDRDRDASSLTHRD